MSIKLLILLYLCLPILSFSQKTDSTSGNIEEPLFKLYIERYILDEIKSLRKENQ